MSRKQIGLPSAGQVAKADGKVYTDYPSLEKTWLSQWEGNADYSLGENAPYGYWTSSPDYSVNDSNYSFAWAVHYSGALGSFYIGNSMGVRPVINLKI